MASLHEGQWGDDVVSAAAYRNATTVVAQLRSEAAVYGRLGVPADRIALCGAASAGVGESSLDVRTGHGIAGPLVLFLGARRPHKGVDVLLGAVPLVHAARPDTTFAFVGPGPALESAEPRVLDIGAVGDDGRSAWITAADLVVLPSAAESFGLVVLEAWSAGTPVVVSPIPALSELVEDSGGGVVAGRNPAAVAAAVLDLLGDPARREALGRAGHAAWLEHYTPAAVAGRFEALYESLLPAAPGQTLLSQRERVESVVGER
jgi:glycosyltransferase involved in cell wall biosynthesis